ncbi:MAG: radical SAM protein [Dehalococcoidia bacterium]|jgi:MoaA/NifB/PqqE/SkfB family radical SAM enzyme
MNFRSAFNNLLSAPKNLVYRSLTKPLKPKWVVMAITDKCNSKCKHCNIWQQKPTDNPLSPKEIYDTLSSPLFDNVCVVMNTGGECTLRDDLFEVLMAEHEAIPKARIIISTNGLLPDRVIGLVQKLKEKDICISIGTSLDGIGSSHDEIRGVPGNFKKVDSILRSLKDEDITPGFVLSDLTIDNLPDVTNYLNEQGRIPLVQWCNSSPFYGKDNPDPDRDRMIKVVESLDPTLVGDLLIKNAWLRWLRGKEIGFPCFAMQTFLVLKCNGDVVPCLTKWDTKAGNIREDSIENIWKSQQAKLTRIAVKNCEGCLNSWGAGWSHSSAFYPSFQYLRSPKILWKILCSR